MKIITKNAVYVQKNDIGFLNQTDLSIPVAVFMKVFGNEITIIDNSNRFEFVKFTEKDEIDFFSKLDWIVEYNSVKDLDESQILELAASINEQKNNIAKKYNAMSTDERKTNVNMFYECERLDFKIYSLRDILWFKQGHIHFNLPECVEYPKDSKKNEEKGLRRILKKFKKN